MTVISTMTSPTRRVVVLAPRGSLTVDDCAALRDALRSAAQEAGLLVVDLLDVPEMDPAAIDVLVGASARCAASGTRFVVANAGPQPWLALTRARVAGVLKLHQRGTEPLADLLQLLEL